MKNCLGCKKFRVQGDMPNRDWNRSNFCNLQCAGVYKRSRPTKNCLNCKKEFTQKRKNTCCSIKCRWELKGIKDIKDCLSCSKVFKRTSQSKETWASKKYCSLACKTLHGVGPAHPMWKGRVTSKGYKGAPRGGLEHRAIMEAAIGRKLKSTEVVHHWDENKANNALDNLCLMRSRSAHTRLHEFSRRSGIAMVDLKFNQDWLYAE